MRGLHGKVALIAGAAPGNIGAATALRLAEEGMKVMVADLNLEAATEVAKAIAEITSADVRAAALDLTDESSYRRLIDTTLAELGALHGLFNVAADLSRATIGRDSNVLDVPFDVWEHTISVTLTGYMYGIRHALPVMMQQGTGSIVNTMSSSIWLGEPEHVAYQAAKSGLVGLTRHTATVGGKSGVRTNLLSPGVTLTKAALATTTEEWRQEALASVRSPRLGRPEDIAPTVAFLFSDDATYINGQSILVDGGASFT
jgi:NAD(P)-dependent dehydrogenase (short-subunit alcohol dehydrogenase family)